MARKLSPDGVPVEIPSIQRRPPTNLFEGIDQRGQQPGREASSGDDPTAVGPWAGNNAAAACDHQGNAPRLPNESAAAKGFEESSESKTRIAGGFRVGGPDDRRAIRSGPGSLTRPRTPWWGGWSLSTARARARRCASAWGRTASVAARAPARGSTSATIRSRGRTTRRSPMTRRAAHSTSCRVAAPIWPIWTAAPCSPQLRSPPEAGSSSGNHAAICCPLRRALRLERAGSCGGSIVQVDVAWGQIQGTRDSQQDAVACLAWPSGLHLLVVADGIGGQAGGDVASGTVVSNFRDAFVAASNLLARDRLLQALEVSNHALSDRIEAEPQLAGMGTTIVAATVDESVLQWVSVGDSSLWLVRDREIRRLNANHSVGAMLDAQVRAGCSSAREAASAPDRSHLLDAVLGRQIKLVDAPSDQFDLRPSDRLVLGSDGLETCSRDVLGQIAAAEGLNSAGIVDSILQEVEGSAKACQDNASVVVVQFAESEGSAHAGGVK